MSFTRRVYVLRFRSGLGVKVSAGLSALASNRFSLSGQAYPAARDAAIFGSCSAKARAGKACPTPVKRDCETGLRFETRIGVREPRLPLRKFFSCVSGNHQLSWPVARYYRAGSPDGEGFDDLSFHSSNLGRIPWLNPGTDIERLCALGVPAASTRAYASPRVVGHSTAREALRFERQTTPAG